MSQLMYMCVCCYGLHEVSWFVRSVPQNVTGDCVVLLAICSLRYCFVVIDVLLMCLIFLIKMHPIFVRHILHDQPLWSVSPCSNIVLWFKGSPSLHWMATVNATGIIEGSLRLSLVLIVSY